MNRYLITTFETDDNRVNYSVTDITGREVPDNHSNKIITRSAIFATSETEALALLLALSVQVNVYKSEG